MIETSRNTVEFSQNVWKFIKVKELDLKEKKKTINHRRQSNVCFRHISERNSRSLNKYDHKTVVEITKQGLDIPSAIRELIYYTTETAMYKT